MCQGLVEYRDLSIFSLKYGFIVLSLFLYAGGVVIVPGGGVSDRDHPIMAEGGRKKGESKLEED